MYKNIKLFILGILLVSALQGQTLKGRFLFDSATAKIPAKGLKVILVPSNSYNEARVSDLYFRGDDSRLLTKMKASVSITNTEGYYYFKAPGPGKYIIKVCMDNGVYYRFSIPKTTQPIILIKDMLALYSLRAQQAIK